MQFREEEVVDLTDQRIDPAVSDPRTEYAERTIPVRIQVPVLICEDCGAEWPTYETGGDGPMVESYERHREKYAPECGSDEAL